MNKFNVRAACMEKHIQRYLKRRYALLKIRDLILISLVQSIVGRRTLTGCAAFVQLIFIYNDLVTLLGLIEIRF